MTEQPRRNRDDQRIAATGQRMICQDGPSVVGPMELLHDGPDVPRAELQEEDSVAESNKFGVGVVVVGIAGLQETFFCSICTY